jgi:transcriptional regulator GlxA family with amidase domain
MMLRGAEDNRPKLAELAHIVNMSARTLERYLALDGVSFRELALRIRHERARHMLDTGDYAISQIAY